jgi:hypothetical protein
VKQASAKEWMHTDHALSLPTLARRITWLVMLISIIGSLAACQSTPTTPPVISKQHGIQVQTNTHGTSSLQGVQQPTVTDSITHGQVTLNIGAKPQLPQTAKMPVITVQPERFTQDTADKVIKTFIKGKQLYTPNDVQTKEEVQKLDILHQALQLQDTPSSGSATSPLWQLDNYYGLLQDTPSSGSATSTGGSPGAAPSSDSDGQQGISQAPATVQNVPSTGQLTTVHEGDLVSNGVTYKGFQGQSLDAMADLGMGYNNVNLFINSSDSAKDCLVRFTNLDITSVYDGSQPTGSVVSARGVKMSLDQAKILAQNTLNDVGATGLTLTSVQLGTLIPLTKNDNPNTMQQAYALWFTRDVSGVPTTLDMTDARPPDNESYPYERVFMLINDTGVIGFSWTSPMTVTGTVSSNAKVLSFNDIMNTFKEQFFLHYAQNDPSKGSHTYTINRITLGMMRVQAQNQANSYMMIPVWDFYGTDSTTVNGVTTSDIADHTLHSFLTISALDGSTINRNLGY